MSSPKDNNLNTVIDQPTNLDIRFLKPKVDVTTQSHILKHKCLIHGSSNIFADTFDVFNTACLSTDEENQNSEVPDFLLATRPKIVPCVFHTNMFNKNNILPAETQGSAKDMPDVDRIPEDTTDIHNLYFLPEEQSETCATSSPSSKITQPSWTQLHCKHTTNNNVSANITDSTIDVHHICARNPGLTISREGTRPYLSHCADLTPCQVYYRNPTTRYKGSRYADEQSGTTGDFSLPRDNRNSGCPMRTDLFQEACLLHQANQFNLFDPEEPSSTTRLQAVEQHSKISTRMYRWLAMFLACLIVLLVLTYRIIQWYHQYEAMKHYFVYTNQMVNADREDLSNVPLSTNLSAVLPYISEMVDRKQGPTATHRQPAGLVVTICNVNPLRGTALFAFQNGPSIYDLLLRRRQSNFGNLEAEDSNRTSRRTLLSVDLISRSGHRIEEMLKRCQSGNTMYYYNNFSSILTRHGLCHLVQLDSQDREIEFLMDPQEYDYLLPNSDLVGLRVWVHASESQARSDLQLGAMETHVHLLAFGSVPLGVQPNEFVVSPAFHTISRIAIGLQGKQQIFFASETSCLPSQRCSLHSEEETQAAEIRMQQKPTASVSPNVWRSSRNSPLIPMTAYLLSTTQTPKSPILYSILALRNPSLYSRSPRTLVNRTAFEELEKLRVGFSELQNELRRTTTQLYLLRKQLWNDERSLMQRAERNTQCLTSSLQHIRSLVNTSSSFYEDLCALPRAEQLYTGNILHCNISIEDDFRTNISEEDIRRKTILFGQMSHGFSVDNHYGKTRADMVEQYAETSKSNLLELQLIHLLFATSTSGSQLKDVLRKYLRPLSAKRMQLKPRVEGPQSRENLQDRQELGPSDRFGKSHSSDLCDGRSQMGLEEKFHDWLVEIGKQIAASLQRLELFVDSMNAIVSSNRPIIEAFQFSEGNISRIHPTGLVSFTIQLEADSNYLMTHQVTSLDTVLNPFGEILGICFAFLGILIPLLLLIDYGFNQTSCRQRVR
ncbi:hypothetical protein CRM22_008616 [Opisthorchis felineus]|uniref:Acid sensing ion channel 4 pituitary n=1 Tax=Opisthorchis felineus TaxID=147828 RepID=A0A4S2LB35_OPIFE|nr:hypothetical protein CRM22_008616 [Opisthorchis felineus]